MYLKCQQMFLFSEEDFKCKKMCFKWVSRVVLQKLQILHCLPQRIFDLYNSKEVWVWTKDSQSAPFFHKILLQFSTCLLSLDTSTTSLMHLLDSSSEVVYLTVCREYSDSASTTKQRTEQNMKGNQAEISLPLWAYLHGDLYQQVVVFENPFSLLYLPGQRQLPPLLPYPLLPAKLKSY